MERGSGNSEDDSDYMSTDDLERKDEDQLKVEDLEKKKGKQKVEDLEKKKGKQKVDSDSSDSSDDDDGCNEEEASLIRRWISNAESSKVPQKVHKLRKMGVDSIFRANQGISFGGDFLSNEPIPSLPASSSNPPSSEQLYDFYVKLTKTKVSSETFQKVMYLIIEEGLETGSDLWIRVFNTVREAEIMRGTHGGTTLRVFDDASGSYFSDFHCRLMKWIGGMIALATVITELTEMACFAELF